MRRRTFERRLAHCGRIAKGIGYEVVRSRKGYCATIDRFARELGLNTFQALQLLNPTRPAPPLSVRRALETFSARWPGGPVRAAQWWK